MLVELKSLLERWSKNQPLFGGSGGRGGDDENKDKPGKEGNDPFENFDFTRFKSSRPQGDSGSGAGSGSAADKDNERGSGKDKDKDKDRDRDKDKSFDPDDFPVTSRRPGGGRGGSGAGGNGGFNFGGNQFGSFGGGQLPQVRVRLPGRRAITYAIVALLVLALVVVGPSLIGFWTDLLWFEEVGQTGVLWTRVLQPLIVFAVAFVIAFAVITLNVSAARRFGPTGPVIAASPDNPLAVLIGGGVRFLNTIFVIGTIIVSFILAGTASSNWQTILFYLNAANWSEKETIFNNSIGFYVFEAPFYSFLQGWAVGLFFVALAAAMSVYFLRFSLSGRAFSITPAIKTHASVLGAIILGLFAFGYQISNWNLVYSTRGRTIGTSATDFDAQFPANTILTFVVAAAALLLLANIFIRDLRLGVRLLVAASTVWLVSHILVSNIYPTVYQNFSVTPNAITKERPFIENSIKMTRKAYGLEFDKDLQVVPFQGTATLTTADVRDNPYIQENARLWDYDKLRGIYDLTQTLRPYYDFEDIDIDRYNLDTGSGPRKTQVLLGARELNLEGLNVNARNWQSLHLQYTHGYGLQASPVNQVDNQGRPVNLITQSFPLSSTLLPVSQPRIYYGQKERPNDYSIVGTRLEEIDYPFQQQGAPEAKYRYAGKGGVSLANWFVKAGYSLKLGDFNLLLSNELTDNSRLIFRRSITERIRQITPFLSLDQDPYLIVAEGRLYWMQDAYTTSSRFPHSDPLNRRTTSEFNYIRNSVKIVIDAYDGTVTYYLVDKPSVDPVAQTYANIYPTLFKPFSQMPPALREHVRYPEFLFKVQTERYQTFHVTDPTQFFNNQDLWQLPADPRPAESRPNSGAQFEPYYLVTRLPGERENEFVLINVFQPQNRNNLVSWMAARMDGENYGKLRVYNFDPSVNIDGPAQFFSKVQSLPDFSRQQSLFSTGTSRLPAGPIIIIPVDNSVLYVMPYYLQAQATALPQLQFVATGANERVFVSQPDSNDDRTRLLPTALLDVFTRGQQVAVSPGAPGTVTNPANPSTTPGRPPGGTPPPLQSPAALPTPAGASQPGLSPAPVGPTIAPGQQSSIAELVRSIRAHQELASQAFAAGDAARGNAELQAASNDLARLNQLLGR